MTPILTAITLFLNWILSFIILSLCSPVKTTFKHAVIFCCYNSIYSTESTVNLPNVNHYFELKRTKDKFDDAHHFRVSHLLTFKQPKYIKHKLIEKSWLFHEQWCSNSRSLESNNLSIGQHSHERWYIYNDKYKRLLRRDITDSKKMHNKSHCQQFGEKY